jgi:hypothetical protein
LINNRQNGRRRGRGGGQQRPQGNPGRPDGGGNRIDNRARGNAQQLHEKYKNLARDSQMAGDRVTTEYYLQFADHYFRVLNEARARFEDQRRQRGETDEEFDGDEGGDEFEAVDNGQRQHQGRDRNENRDRNDRNGYRPDDDRGEREQNGGGEQQVEQPRYANDAPQQNEAREDEGQRRERRPRRRREESEQPEALGVDRLPPAIAVEQAGDEAPAPRRRGRRPRVETANDTVEVPPAA